MHHFIFGLLGQLFYSLNACTFEAVVGADRQLKIFDHHCRRLRHFFRNRRLNGEAFFEFHLRSRINIIEIADDNTRSFRNGVQRRNASVGMNVECDFVILRIVTKQRRLGQIFCGFNRCKGCIEADRSFGKVVFFSISPAVL